MSEQSVSLSNKYYVYYFYYFLKGQIKGVKVSFENLSETIMYEYVHNLVVNCVRIGCKLICIFSYILYFNILN
jgi:hypothetical protein